MGWFMPSYKRPHHLRELLSAPGGWPKHVVVLINQDQIADYWKVFPLLPATAPWRLFTVPEGSSCSDAKRYASNNYPNEKFYGLLMDDLWPVTPGWHTKLVEAAGDYCISIANGANSGFPTQGRGALCLGGDLVRDMGSLVPAPVKHWYEDNIWDEIAAKHGLLRPVEDAVVDHRHHMHGTAPHDETYDRSQVNAEADAEVFKAWMASDERKVMDARIREGQRLRAVPDTGQHGPDMPQ